MGMGRQKVMNLLSLLVKSFVVARGKFLPQKEWIRMPSRDGSVYMTGSIARDSYIKLGLKRPNFFWIVISHC